MNNNIISVIYENNEYILFKNIKGKPLYPFIYMKAQNYEIEITKYWKE